jgi:transcriptional regulator with XRE-family HTH domain
MRTEFSAGGVTQNDLAEKYGIAAQNVSLILTGKTYTTEISHSRLTSADDIAIRGMISNGARHEDAAIAFGVSIAAIGRSLKRSARTTQAA